MLKNIKIAVDKPIVADGSNVIHTGTSYQVSKIPDFSKSNFFILNIVNDTENLLSKRFDYELSDTQALYVRTKYHYNGNRESNWSKIMPLRGDQIGIKLSSTVINTPSVEAEINRDHDGIVIIKTGDFSLFAGVGVHESTSYEVVDTDGTVIYNREKDLDNLTSIILPLDKFDTSKSYIIKAKHHTDNNADSNYGKCLFGINTGENTLFDLDLPYYFVPMRNIWFKLSIYTPNYKSIDIRIVDKYNDVVAVEKDQHTVTPSIYTGNIIIGEMYNIQARLTFLDGTRTNFITTQHLKAELNVLMHINKYTTYLGKHDFSQYINTNGESIQNTYESYSHGILLGKSNSNDIYRYRHLNSKLYEMEKALTLENVETIHKVFTNIVPIHSSRLLIDFSAGVTGDNIKSPVFRVYRYNVITQTFTFLHEVKRDDERYSTAVSASLVPTVGDSVYYIPTEEVDNNNNDMLTLKVYNATNNIFNTVDKLPVNIKKHGSLVKISDTELMFFGGVNDPIPNTGGKEYIRSNNDVYIFNTITTTWTKINTLPDFIPDTIYNIQAYTRKDGKIVLFNACEEGASVGNQNTYVYDIQNNFFDLEESDTEDTLRYNSTIVYQNGDFGRISNHVIDPQKIFTYISNTKGLVDINDNLTIDTNLDLVVPENTEITIESPYRYNSITILGTNYENSGILHWIRDDEVLDFQFRDLIVTRDMALTNNIYDPLEPWDSITILDGADFTVSNVLWVPDGIKYIIDAPFKVDEIKIGDNAELIVNTEE